MQAGCGMYGIARADRACARVHRQPTRQSKMWAFDKRNGAGGLNLKSPNYRNRSNCCWRRRAAGVGDVEDADDLEILEDLEDIRNMGDSDPEELEDIEGAAQFEKLELESTGGLGGTSDDVFGPPALLLIGFTPREAEFFGYITKMIVDGEDEVGIVPATQEMMKGTLEEAFKTGLLSPEEKPSPATFGLRRILFFSGLYTYEVIEIIDAYKEVQMSDAVFGAAVPNNWHKNLKELVEEVLNDHKKFNPGGYDAV